MIDSKVCRVKVSHIRRDQKVRGKGCAAQMCVTF